MGVNKPGFIDDRFPFDFSKSLEYNINIIKELLRETGNSEEEIEKFIKEKKDKYFND